MKASSSQIPASRFSNFHAEPLTMSSSESSKSSSRNDSGDRSGLDLLASTLDQVADDLPRRFDFEGHEPRQAMGDAATRTRRASNWRALAAGFFLGALALPIYLVWSGGAEPQPEAGGVAVVEWLSPARQGARGSGEPVSSLIPHHDGPTVLMIDVPRTARTALRDGARLELVRRQAETERVVVSRSLGSAEWISSLERSDGLPIWLAPETLRPGSYRLALWPLAEESVGTAGASAMSLSFRVPEPEE